MPVHLYWCSESQLPNLSEAGSAAGGQSPTAITALCRAAGLAKKELSMPLLIFHFPGATFRLILLLVAENIAASPNPLSQNSAFHLAEAS